MAYSLTANPLLLAIVGVMVAHSWHLWRKGRWLAFDPLNAFWAGALVCYVYQPLSFGDVYAAWHAPGVLEETLSWVLFSLLFVIAGYEAKVGVKLGLKIPALPARLAPRRLVAAGIALMALGFLGYAYLVNTAGGLDEWLSVGRGGTNWEAVSGYVAQLEFVLPVGVMLLAFYASLYRPRLIARVAVAVTCAAMWVWLVYLGSRSRTIGFTLSLMTAYYLPRRRSPSLKLLALVFVGLLAIVTFQASYRSNFTGLSFNFDRLDLDEVKDSLLPDWAGGASKGNAVDTSTSAEFNCVMTVVELVPQRIGYNYGYSHLELFTRVIPRAIWPEKRYPHAEAYTPILREGGLSTAVIPTAKEELLMGPSFTFVGHWYSVGGPIALVIFGFLTGVGFRAIRTIYDRAPTSQGDIIFYSSLIILGFWEVSGEPLFFLFYFPFTHGPLAILLWLSRERRRSPTRGMPARGGPAGLAPRVQQP